jgi:hypothetical protein
MQLLLRFFLVHSDDDMWSTWCVVLFNSPLRAHVLGFSFPSPRNPFRRHKSRSPPPRTTPTLLPQVAHRPQLRSSLDTRRGCLVHPLALTMFYYPTDCQEAVALEVVYYNWYVSKSLVLRGNDVLTANTRKGRAGAGTPAETLA